MQLRDDHALSTIDDERTTLGHHRKIAEEDLLLDGLDEVLRTLFLVLRRQAKTGLERYGVCQTAVLALLYAIARLLETVIEIFEDECLARVDDRKVQLEYGLEAGSDALGERDACLKEFLERLQLHIEKIG